MGFQKTNPFRVATNNNLRPSLAVPLPGVRRIGPCRVQPICWIGHLSGDSAVDGTKNGIPMGNLFGDKEKWTVHVVTTRWNGMEWQQHAAEKSTDQLINWSLEVPNGSNQHFLRHRSLSTAVKAFLPLSGCEQPEQDLKNYRPHQDLGKAFTKWSIRISSSTAKTMWNLL